MNEKKICGELDIDRLTKSLLSCTKKFQNQTLSRLYSVKSNGKKIYKTWRKYGGETSLKLFARDDSIGEFETFAELCFHSLIVRLFGLKWCLDHGYLEQTNLSREWNSILKANSLKSWEKLLYPGGSSEIEKLLRKVLRPTDMYMWIVHHLGDDLRYDLVSAFSSFKLATGEIDILGEFYQKYISIYSKKAQFELGQFYTPHQLVRAMWSLSSDVLSERCLDLASKDVVVVDPSAGTGTFLTQGLRFAINKYWGDQTKRLSSNKIKEFVLKFSGLELNPFSKGVADINYLTSILSHSSDVNEKNVPIPSIFETNSYFLNPKIIKSDCKESSGLERWLERWRESYSAKRKSKYKVVIGNPPWRSPSPALQHADLKNVIRNEIIPWSYEYEGEKLSDLRGCNHGIRDEYMFFYGVADSLVQDQGLVCFVTNESWLMAKTYRLSRKYFLDNYCIKRVIRIGPYFKGVQEKACIVVMEKAGAVGRTQKIQYVDWSDTGNQDWSFNWINSKLEDICSGKMKESAWSQIEAFGEECVLVPIKEEPYGFDNGLIHIYEVFEKIQQGAEPGFTPLFLDRDKTELMRKMRLLFSSSDIQAKRLACELADQVRGGEKKAWFLLKRVRKIIKKEKVPFNSSFFRKCVAYLPELNVRQNREYVFCYFDSRLWAWPRCERSGVSNGLWDSKLKLAYRDFSDVGKVTKKIDAYIEKSNAVIVKHSLNGGCNVLSFAEPCTQLKDKYRRFNFKVDEWCYYIYAILKSNYAVEWGRFNPRQEIKIPADASFLKQMKKISLIGKRNESLLEKVGMKDLTKLEEKRLSKFQLEMDENLKKIVLMGKHRYLMPLDEETTKANYEKL